MGVSKKRRWALGTFALAVVYLIAVYIIPGVVDQSDGRTQPAGDPVMAPGSKKCPKKHRRVTVEQGEHGDYGWSIIAAIKNGHDCAAWGLSVDFRPRDITPGSWEGFWEIPAGGHLPDSATISARDETTGEERVVSGVVGWDVRTVLLTTKSGDRFVVHPKAPERRLLKRFIWLRNLRYFLRFYPLGDPVKVAKLLDSQGRTIATDHFRLGEIMRIP